MNFKLVLVMMLANSSSLPAHQVSSRFYSLPVENLRYLDPSLPGEVLKNQEQSMDVQRRSFERKSSGLISKGITAIYDIKSRRLFVMGGTSADYEHIDRILKAASFFRTTYAARLPASAIFIILWGCAIEKKCLAGRRIETSCSSGSSEDHPSLTA